MVMNQKMHINLSWVSEFVLEVNFLFHFIAKVDILRANLRILFCEYLEDVTSESIEFWFSKTGDTLRIIVKRNGFIVSCFVPHYQTSNSKKWSWVFYFCYEMQISLNFRGGESKTKLTLLQTKSKLSQQYGMVNQNQRSWIFKDVILTLIVRIFSVLNFYRKHNV